MQTDDDYKVVQTGLIDGYEKPRTAKAYGGRSNAITKKDMFLNGLSSDEVSNRIIDGISKTIAIAATANKKDPDSLMNCLVQYIKMCRENDIKVTNSSAMAACGVDRREIDQWASGERKANDPRYMEFATTLRAVCQQYREGMMIEQRINPLTGIWWQKVYDGYQDNMGVHQMQLDEADDMTAAEIAEKYSDIPDE